MGGNLHRGFESLPLRSPPARSTSGIAHPASAGRPPAQPQTKARLERELERRHRPQPGEDRCATPADRSLPRQRGHSSRPMCRPRTGPCARSTRSADRSSRARVTVCARNPPHGSATNGVGRSSAAPVGALAGRYAPRQGPAAPLPRYHAVSNARRSRSPSGLASASLLW
jgi:hypothetical protein